MADFDFPPDLIDIQRRFFDAEEKTRTAEGEEFTEAFRDMRQATIDKHRHPYWASVDDRHKADMALRAAARKLADAGQ